MPRMQVYLPDDLHAELEDAGMPASQLLQDAVRRELRKRELNAAADEYLAEMDALWPADSGGDGRGGGVDGSRRGSAKRSG